MEKCYEEAMRIELAARGLKAETQTPIIVHYKQQIIGEYKADVVVENKVLLELKAVKELHDAHFSQLINYLRATEIEVGLLLNFGSSTAKPHRRVFENRFKKHLSKTIGEDL